MDQRAFSRFPSSSTVSRAHSVTVCHLLDKFIPDRTQVSDFCTCTNCCIQNSARETICCREPLDSPCRFSQNLKAKISDFQCITQVPDIREIVQNTLHLDLFHENDVFLKRQLGISVSTRTLASDPDRYDHCRLAQLYTFL
jgi:hypothetical protein